MAKEHDEVEMRRMQAKIDAIFENYFPDTNTDEGKAEVLAVLVGCMGRGVIEICLEKDSPSPKILISRLKACLNLVHEEVMKGAVAHYHTIPGLEVVLSKVRPPSAPKLSEEEIQSAIKEGLDKLKKALQERGIEVAVHAGLPPGHEDDDDEEG